MANSTLEHLIQDFSTDRIIKFFRERSPKFAPIKESLGDYNDDIFKDGIKLGEIKFDETEELIVCAFKCDATLSERSGKKAQYEKAKKILKERISDAGIFVFYDAAGNFRFSLVYTNYLGKQKDWSTFRRFTYFVNKESTNKTFLQRIGDADFSTLDKIQEAFSVEKVTKEFYENISYWYFWAVKKCVFPKDAEAEENGRNISVIRLITRIIFVWFMRERKLINKELFDKAAINGLLLDVSDDSSTYYQAILQNLFFATLSTKQADRQFRSELRGTKGFNADHGNPFVFRFYDYLRDPEKVRELFIDIPFLNGGLFDCLDDSEKGIYIDGFSETKKNQAVVPNILFFGKETKVDLSSDLGDQHKLCPVKGLLNLLSEFNFTIDENTSDDKDVALDPELLGRVFENLLASFNPETSSTARKATGSYYTPREIVDYMVDESLKGYLLTHLLDIKEIDRKINDLFSQEEGNPFTLTESKRIVNLVESVRVVDPAVGSGAFPMGILNRLVYILHKVDRNNDFWKQAQIDTANQFTDPRIKQEAIGRINEYFKKNPNYGRKLFLIQKCIYGVDIQQIAVEIAKLRFFISLLVDEDVDKSKENWGIEPLPNLDFKIMQGNSLISEFLGVNFEIKNALITGQVGFDFQNEKSQLISQFESKKIEYQNESEKEKKKQLLTEIDNIIIEIFTMIVKQQKENYFYSIESIIRKTSVIPNKEEREGIVRREVERINKRFGFDLERSEFQLREYTGKLKTRPFFPWQLYFAEVFTEKNGFDIVIGNPPYVRVHKQDDSQKQYIRTHYSSALGDFDLYIIFIEKSLHLINNNGIVTLITPDKFLVREYGENIRKIILTNFSIKELYDISRAIDAFTASVYPLVSLITGKKQSQKVRIRFAKSISQLNNPLEEYSVDQNELSTNGLIELITQQNRKIIQKIYDRSKSLGEIIIEGQIFCGTPRAKDYYSWTKGIVLKQNENTPKLIVCSNISPYLIDHAKQIRTLGIKVFQPYFSNEKKLISDDLWKSFNYSPKILIRGNDKRITAVLDDSPSVFIGVYAIKIFGELKLYSKYLTAFLNSTICQWVFQKKNPSIKIGGGYFSINSPQILSLPFCKPDEELLTRINHETDIINSLYLENKERDISEQLDIIDALFFKLFDLSNDEITLIKKDLE